MKITNIFLLTTLSTISYVAIGMEKLAILTEKSVESATQKCPRHVTGHPRKQVIVNSIKNELNESIALIFPDSERYTGVILKPQETMGNTITLHEKSQTGKWQGVKIVFFPLGTKKSKKYRPSGKLDEIDLVVTENGIIEQQTKRGNYYE
jgi:hypothetical protein